MDTPKDETVALLPTIETGTLVSNSLDEILPGDQYSTIKTNLKQNGIAKVSDDIYIAADFDSSGNVLSLAAAVSRTPKTSYNYLRAVPDFKESTLAGRKARINFYHTVANKEGVINNAIKKAAAMISQRGAYKVRDAKQGKRPKAKVLSDLLVLLNYFAENVNSSHEEGVVTGSRGMVQIVRRGGRQAMIEGDLFIREVWRDVKVPQLANRVYSLPILLQAIPSGDIEEVLEIFAIGLELFYWVPPGDKLSQITGPTTPEAKELVSKIFTPKIQAELRKSGKVILEPSLLIHIKHGGTDISVFGESMVEPALADLAYHRALRSLDFVTIESLINRLTVIKIGDPNKESDYHNLATAQARVNTFRNLLGQLGPNMMVVWAGHDVEALDIGAHDKLLDATARMSQTIEAVKTAMGVPEPVLTGSAPGGKGVAWAGLLSLGAVVEELQEEFSQALTQLGKRIAVENGFEDADVIWEFENAVSIDKESNAKIMLQAYQYGLIGKQSAIEAIGKNYEAERLRRSSEDERGDADLFGPPPIQSGGPQGQQGVNPESQPGRERVDPNKLGPDRELEDKEMD